MKKILALILSVVMALTMVGCGCDSTQKTPDDFKLFNMELGGLTQEAFVDTLKQGITDYGLLATLDGESFPVAGSELGLALNENFDLEGIVTKIAKGEITAEEIESQLLQIGEDSVIKKGLINCYSAFLQNELASAKAAEQAAAEDASENKTASLDSYTLTSDPSIVGGVANVNVKDTATDEAADVTPVTLTEEEMAEIQKKIEGLVDSTMAKIEYSEEAGKFVGVDGQAGETRDYSKAISTLKENALKMSDKADLVTETSYSEGQKASESEDVAKALEIANSYFDLTITYNFSCPDGPSGSETINSSNIREYIYVDTNGLDIAINTDNLSLYASNIAKKYSDVDEETKSNDDGTATVTRKGYETSSTSIYNNLLDSLKNRKSGSFTASYSEVNETKTTDYGNVYIYINLSSQTMTLYENNVAILSTPIVSGCVANGHCTPTGTYSIYYKQAGATLRGADYSCWVDYWMPFNGGIGIHDATWRSTFGGTYYFTDGSHGCINTPHAAAATIFSKVKAGTKIVVVGGVTSIELKSQHISIPSSLSLEKGESYKLDVGVYGNPDLTFESGDSSVASVSSDGTIYANGKGSCSIFVAAERTADGQYDYTYTWTTVFVSDTAGDRQRNQDAANSVISQINNIGTVTLSSESAINSARSAYNSLTYAQKELVSNYSTLTAAEGSLQQLKDQAKEQQDRDAANTVVSKINNIGTVTLASETAINDARSAYNNLTSAQKGYVTNYSTLEAAESTLAGLKN